MGKFRVALFIKVLWNLLKLNSESWVTHPFWVSQWVWVNYLFWVTHTQIVWVWVNHPFWVTHEWLKLFEYESIIHFEYESLKLVEYESIIHFEYESLKLVEYESIIHFEYESLKLFEYDSIIWVIHFEWFMSHSNEYEPLGSRRHGSIEAGPLPLPETGGWNLLFSFLYLSYTDFLLLKSEKVGSNSYLSYPFCQIQSLIILWCTFSHILVNKVSYS